MKKTPPTIESLKASGKMGLARMEEQIGVYVEAVGKSFALVCAYERDKDGKVISFGEVKEVGGLISGRFKFFGDDTGPADGEFRV